MAAQKWPPNFVDFSTFTDFDENWYSGYFGDGKPDGGIDFSKFQNGRPKWPLNFAYFSTFTDFDENWYSGYFRDGEQDGDINFSKFQNGG